MAKAGLQLSQTWPPEGRQSFGDLIEQLVGPEHWSALLEMCRCSVPAPIIPGEIYEPHYDPRWAAAMRACSQLVNIWNAGDLIAEGRRRDPLAPHEEIAPPRVGWTLVVYDFERSIIFDPIVTRTPGPIYDLRFSPSSNRDGAKVSKALSDAANWIITEAQRLKAANKVSVKNRKTKAAFAEFLANRMSDAANAGHAPRPIGRDYIRNYLSSWGLWPFDSIE